MDLSIYILFKKEHFKPYKTISNHIDLEIY